MKPSRVARLDLRLPLSEASVLRHPQYFRPLLYASICGLLSGLWLVSEIRPDQHTLEQRDSLQAELAALQAAQRQREAELKTLQVLEDQWRQHLAHQEGWQSVRLLMQALGNSAELSARLTQLRFDSQGLTLSGQVAPPQLQPWLHRFTAQIPGLGPWRSLEIGGQEDLEDSDLEPSTRFVIRFRAKAASGPVAP